jgi:hypothetical protein
MNCQSDITAGWNHVCFLNSTNQADCFGVDDKNQLVPKGYIAKDPDETRHFYNTLRFESISSTHMQNCGVLTGVCKTDDTLWPRPPLMNASQIAAANKLEPRAKKLAMSAVHPNPRPYLVPVTNETCKNWRNQYRTPLCWGASMPVRQINQRTPTQVTLVKIVTGPTHTCGIRSDGRLECWGDRLYGKTNIGDAKCRVKTQGIGLVQGARLESQTCTTQGAARYVDVSLSVSHTCAVRQGDLNIVCWGRNRNYELGMPKARGKDAAYCYEHPGECCNFQQINCTTRGTFVQVSAGLHFSCGLRTNGSVACWGDNTWGKATPPHPHERFTRIVSSLHHSCGILESSGHLRCWGRNEGKEATPPGGDMMVFANVAVGEEFTCATEIGRVSEYTVGEVTGAGSMVDQTTWELGKDTGAVVCWGLIDRETFDKLGPEKDPKRATNLRNCQELEDGEMGEKAGEAGGKAFQCRMFGKELTSIGRPMRAPVRCRNRVVCPLAFSETNINITGLDTNYNASTHTTTQRVNAARILRDRLFHTGYHPVVCAQIPFFDSRVPYSEWKLYAGQKTAFNLNSEYQSAASIVAEVKAALFGGKANNSDTPHVSLSIIETSDADVNWADTYEEHTDKVDDYLDIAARKKGGPTLDENGKVQLAKHKFRLYCFSFTHLAQPSDSVVPVATHREAQQEAVHALFREKADLLFMDQSNEKAGTVARKGILWNYGTSSAKREQSE